MYNYNKIIDQIELMSSNDKVEFVNKLCDRNPNVAFTLANSIEVTMMDKVFLENEKKVQKAIK
jgi:hypothetical protein